MSDDLDLETVLVFPDYTIVADIPRSREGAQALWESTVDPDVGRGGAGTLFQKSSLKTWVLPYSCVILLCKSMIFFVALLTGFAVRFTQEEG